MGHAVAKISGLSVRLATVPSTIVAGSRVRWILIVTNTSDHSQTLSFATSQRVDIVLECGRIEWYRWSDQRLFLPQTETSDLSRGATWHCGVVDDLRVPPVDYLLHATVLTDPQPLQVDRHLTVHQPERGRAVHRPRPDPPRPACRPPSAPTVRRTEVNVSGPSAALYGRCGHCFSARDLIAVATDDAPTSYEAHCPDCGGSEPLTMS